MKRKIVLTLILSLCIGSSSALAAYVDNGDGTVTDTETGLMWQQATGGDFTWPEALEYCNNLTLAGYSDWRLPTRNELQSLVDYSRYSPAIDTFYFPNTYTAYYWSSSSDASSPGNAWLVYFSNGGVYHYDKGSEGYRVRAVRGGQPRSFGHLVIWLFPSLSRVGFIMLTIP